MKLNVYEYKIGKVTGSYTVIAGCPNEAILKAKLKSHKVQSFEHIKREIYIPAKEHTIIKLSY